MTKFTKSPRIKVLIDTEIKKVFEETKHNVNYTAEILGVSDRFLRARLRSLGYEPQNPGWKVRDKSLETEVKCPYCGR